MKLHPEVANRIDEIEARRDRDAGSRRAHHRQDRPARQLRRSRPLHSVYGCRAADLRPPHRGRLRRHGCGGSSHRRTAREDDREGKSRVHEGLFRPRETLHRQTRCRCSSRTGRRPKKSRSISRSGTASAAQRGSRSFWRSLPMRSPDTCPARQTECILAAAGDAGTLDVMPIHRFMDFVHARMTRSLTGFLRQTGCKILMGLECRAALYP